MAVRTVHLPTYPPHHHLSTSTCHATPAKSARRPHSAGMVERVKRLLGTDTDVQVIANCLSVLMQVRRRQPARPPAVCMRACAGKGCCGGRLGVFAGFGWCSTGVGASFWVVDWLLVGVYVVAWICGNCTVCITLEALYGRADTPTSHHEWGRCPGLMHASTPLPPSLPWALHLPWSHCLNLAPPLCCCVACMRTRSSHPLSPMSLRCSWSLRPGWRRRCWCTHC